MFLVVLRVSYMFLVFLSFVLHLMIKPIYIYCVYIYIYIYMPRAPAWAYLLMKPCWGRPLSRKTKQKSRKAPGKSRHPERKEWRRRDGRA
jgi:hypothetical protein